MRGNTDQKNSEKSYCKGERISTAVLLFGETKIYKLLYFFFICTNEANHFLTLSFIIMKNGQTYFSHRKCLKFV